MNLITLDQSVVDKVQSKSKFLTFEDATALQNTDTQNTFLVTKYQQTSNPQEGNGVVPVTFYQFRIYSDTFRDVWFSPQMILIDGKFHTPDAEGDSDLFYEGGIDFINTEELEYLDAPSCNKDKNLAVVTEMYEVMKKLISDHFGIVCDLPLSWANDRE
jgi:hypothetical protein